MQTPPHLRPNYKRKSPGRASWLDWLAFVVVVAGVAAVLAFIIVGICSAAPPTPAPLEGKVVAVYDGDTLTVLDSAKRQHKIRLEGIDAPERRQAFGTQSKDLATILAFGEKVSVRVASVDRYGRLIGDVTLPDGKVMSEEMIKAGLAHHYKQYSKSKVLADLETAARKAKVGVWVLIEPTPPWEFRKLKAPSPPKRRPRSVLKRADWKLPAPSASAPFNTQASRPCSSARLT